MKIIVDRGLDINQILAKVLRSNGLHILQVHNGLIIRHGKLEEVKDADWVKEAMATESQPKPTRKRAERPVESVTSET